ncbi:O-methyltransferase domain-containing protein 1 [Elsinoe fawcettii]|nr:O-methyltransferase domain-containing protein 1 [Elsinoe fawcettii]
MAPNLVTTTISALKELQANPPKDAQERLELYNELRRLLPVVESPSNSAWRILYGNNPLVLTAIAVNLRIFHILTTSPATPYALNELAQTTHADPALLARVLRGLAAYDLIAEVDEDTYQASPSSFHFTDAGVEAGVRCHVRMQERFRSEIPDFLKETGYKNPEDHEKMVWHKASGYPIWEYFKRNTEDERNFGKFMSAYRAGTNEFWEVVPIQTMMSGVGKDEVALLDIGGGKGHQAIGLKKAFPGISGRFVVQDLEYTVKASKDVVKDFEENTSNAEQETLDKVEFHAHDFFTEQPIKGARVYYLRSILHDWADHDCERILQRQHEAMSAGSLLLLDEIVLPNKGASWQSIQMDMTMMLVSSFERREKDWSKLVTKAGFTIDQIYRVDKQTGYSVIVCKKT